MEWVLVGDRGAAIRAEVLVALERLHAERNEAKAEDPAADQDDKKAEKPLESRSLALHVGLASLTTCVALHLKWPLVPGWDAVWSDQRRRRRSDDILHRRGNCRRLADDRLNDLGLLDRVKVSDAGLLLGHGEHGHLFLWTASLRIDSLARIVELSLGLRSRHFVYFL